MPVAYLGDAATGSSERRQQRQDAGLRALLMLAHPAAVPPRTRAPAPPAPAEPAPPAPAGPAAPVQAQPRLSPAAARARAGRRGGRRAGIPIPLLVVLCAQAVLSAQLIRGDTAFADEALYLWAGHLEWAHWLHGTPVPAFPTYFSGSPVIYPPLAALADGIGGLAAARLLSLCFMLGATALLWATASRLFGRRAGFFAAALFAAAGPTLHLGSFATYDAPALLLLALAGWCATGACRRADATGWILGAAGALLAANATKYATTLFDPVVIAVAALSACPEPGGKAALRRGTLLTACLTGGLAVLIRLGGPLYLRGIEQTTTLRAAGGSPAPVVLFDSWHWTAVVLALAVLAVPAAAALGQPRLRTAMLGVLAAAALLAPVEQARIHTTVSLDKHVDFGAWFAAIAAGWAAAEITRRWHNGRPRALATAACAVTVGAAATAGIASAPAMVNWPDSARLISLLRPRVADGGRFLAEDAAVPEYYLRGRTNWRQWSSTFSITLPSGRVRNEHGNPAPYVAAIRRHYFRLVILSFTDTPALDRPIVSALQREPGYHPIGTLPLGPGGGHYVVWEYRPRSGQGAG